MRKHDAPALTHDILISAIKRLASKQQAPLVGLQLFSKIAKTGYQHTLILEKAHGTPAQPSREYQYVKNDGVVELYQLLTVRIYSILEAFCSDCVRHIVAATPTAASREALYKIKRPVIEILDQAREQTNELLYREFMDSIQASQKIGIGRFEEPLKLLGFGAAVPPTVKDAVFLLSQFRHCIVHSGGLVDQRLASTCPRVAEQIGSRLNIGIPDLRRFLLATAWYINDIPARVSQSLGNDEPEAKTAIREIEELLPHADRDAANLPFAALDTTIADDLPYGIEILILEPKAVSTSDSKT